MNEQTIAKQCSLPDFVELWNRFQTKLTNGQRAEIRRSRGPDDLDFMPAFYRLLPSGQKPDTQWRRVILFLPCAPHNNNADTLGAQLARSRINEKRLFQIARSEPPNDLLYLRRILQQTQPVVNWQQFGEMLYFWGDNRKKKLLEDYFTTINQ